jgi:hypothetical protein
MFQISNDRKMGDNSFITAKGRPVTLRPGKTLQFNDDDLNDGILRTMVGRGSHYKVIADTAEAQEMIDNAQQRKAGKGAGSPLVQGSHGPRHMDRAEVEKVIEVRDHKLKAEVAAGADSGDKKPPAAPEGGDGQQVKQEPEVTKVFIQEEVKDKSPLEKLIEVAKDKPYTELVTEAKELLGDAFPGGRPGRGDITKALIEHKAAQDKPQE